MTDTDARKPFYGLDARQWQFVIDAAYRNLPDNTTITPWDVDAILTWCIPLYNEYRRENAHAQ